MTKPTGETTSAEELVIPEGCWVEVHANERGRLFSLRLMAPHYTGEGEVLAKDLEFVFAKKLQQLINGQFNYGAAREQQGYLKGLEAAARTKPSKHRGLIGEGHYGWSKAIKAKNQAIRALAAEANEGN
jgi:hypothetical protein